MADPRAYVGAKIGPFIIALEMMYGDRYRENM